MLRRVIDANVPIVANGRGTNATPTCQLNAILRLRDILSDGQIVIDDAGEMIEEYKRYCEPRGQPGVGDRFFREILMNYNEKVLRVRLDKDEHGNYVDFPNVPELANFDADDIKFAAAARKTQTPVLNATDSDWLDYINPLVANGIHVEFVCGLNSAAWIIA